MEHNIGNQDSKVEPLPKNPIPSPSEGSERLIPVPPNNRTIAIGIEYNTDTGGKGYLNLYGLMNCNDLFRLGSYLIMICEGERGEGRN